MNTHDATTADHFSEKQMARLAAAQEAKRLLSGVLGGVSPSAIIQLAQWILEGQAGESDD